MNSSIDKVTVEIEFGLNGLTMHDNIQLSSGNEILITSVRSILQPLRDACRFLMKTITLPQPVEDGIPYLLALEELSASLNLSIAGAISPHLDDLIPELGVEIRDLIRKQFSNSDRLILFASCPTKYKINSNGSQCDPCGHNCHKVDNVNVVVCPPLRREYIPVIWKIKINERVYNFTISLAFIFTHP